jgi:hypothetical protein
MILQSPQNPAPGRRGGASLALLVSMLMLASVVTSALVATSSSAALSRGSLAREQALYAAESGANRALWEVAYGAEAWTGWTSLPDGSRQYTGSVQDGDGSSMAAFTVHMTDPAKSISTITATGSRLTGYDAATITRQVRVNVSRSASGPGGWFQWGVYASQSIKVNFLAMVDSYDSSQGSYFSTRGSEVQLATDSTAPGSIAIGSWAVVRGDAFIGPDGDPETGITGRITGTKGALTEGGQPPSIDAPTGISHDIGDVSLINNQELTLTQDTACSSVLMQHDAVLTVNGNVRLYVRGNFEGRGNVRIRVLPGSSLTMYCGGKFVMKDLAIVNWQTHIPEQCIIYGLPTCTEVTLQNFAIAYAAVYAPQAKFTCKNLGIFHGSMVAREAVIETGAALHWDKAVRNLAPQTLPTGGGSTCDGGSSDPWTIRSWQITR